MSTKPPVPGEEASTKLSGDAQSAFPVVLMTSVRVTPFSCSRAGSTWTWSCLSRCPQMVTFATPGTAISRGLIFHRASTERSISEMSVAESPTIMTRLVDALGGTMTGGLPTGGNANACDIRSCTA